MGRHAHHATKKMTRFPPTRRLPAFAEGFGEVSPELAGELGARNEGERRASTKLMAMGEAKSEVAVSDTRLVTRREFVKTAGSAVAATSVLGIAPALALSPPSRRRYAIFVVFVSLVVFVWQP